MIRHFKKAFFCFCFSTIVFSGCATERTIEQPESNYFVETINYQTCGPGITEEELESGRYYVLHNELYYPIAYASSATFSESPDDYVDPTRLIFFTTQTEKNIPTLFLANGDKLIYYNDTYLLDYISWERYRDLGYSIGLYNIQSLTNGRIYVNLEGDEECVLPYSDLLTLYDYNSPYILIDKVGGVQVTNKALKNNMLIGLERGKLYPLELYAGTKYYYCNAVADTKVLSAMELFASVEYETKQGNIYEIKIPDYFTTGYYCIDNGGMLRITTDTEYSLYTDYNVPILITEDNSERPYIYSDFELLNKFQTTVPGALGYVDETKQPAEENSPAEDIWEGIKLATIVERSVYFPLETECKITIKSQETTGDCYVLVDGKRYKLLRQGDTYSAALIGKDSYGTFTITGFFEPIEISYIGCYEQFPPVQEGEDS